MSREQWKIQLHLACAGELRSMAGKVVGANGKAELIRIAENHEELAKSLQGTAPGDVEHRAGAA